MKKTLVSLTDRQMETLDSNSKSLGISKSELLRRILDRYLEVGRRMNEKKPVPKSGKASG
jgi:metal-responsive CopG/Arc/MetJ family transcriptional regulator